MVPLSLSILGLEYGLFEFSKRILYVAGQVIQVFRKVTDAVRSYADSAQD